MNWHIIDFVLIFVVVVLVGAMYLYARNDYARTFIVGNYDFGFQVVFLFAWALLIVDVVLFLICWPSKMWKSAQNSRWKTAHFFGL